MTDTDERPMIEFCLQGEEEPLWVIRDKDKNVPLPDDLVAIENADGTTNTYKIKSRMWVTAKQGKDRFYRVRLRVAEYDLDKRASAITKPLIGLY